jgi:aspartyl-tRNA(Asn)/glutamyl-tRNA(Gln) amidotransferase subunit A
MAPDLRSELAVAGLELDEDEIARVAIVWRDNLPRRAWLRRESFRDDEAPFPGLVPPGEAASDPTGASPPGPNLVLADAGDPTDLDLCAMQRLIASGALSSTELVQLYLRRMERHDGVLRSTITLLAEQALAEAAHADRQRAAGAELGVLHGIPVGIKDCIDVAGAPTTAGSRVFHGRVPVQDAESVARLRASGGIVLAKQSMHEFGAGPALPDGPLATGRNPWDLSRIPGGSSSGGAVAVSAGFCAAALGTDTAGSVRIPAAYTGLVGFKPTHRSISAAGVVPFCWSIDSVGTLTRTVTDAALVLSATAHEAGLRSLAWPGVRQQALEGGVRGMRLGVLRRYYLDQPDIETDMRQAAEEALAIWHSQGAHLVTVDIPSIDHNDAVYTTLLAESFAFHEPMLRDRASHYSDWFRVQLHTAALFTASDVLRARRLQSRLVRETLAVLQGVDALVFPGMAAPATPFGSSFITALTQPRSRFTRPWNITGLPAMALPCGFSGGGLPLSMQVVGRPFDEASVLRVGRAFERETPWHLRRPDPTAWMA